MESFLHWFKRVGIDPKITWLLLGKGPTFSKRKQFDLSRYYTVALNHVVREQSVNVVHAIDIEVVEQCGSVICDNAEILVMPWVPHVRSRPFWDPLGISKHIIFKPSPLCLTDYCERYPVLARLASEGRLVWYNLVTAPASRLRDGSPVIDVFGFSSTAVLNLLAESGVRTVRTLGIDGGCQYSQEFSDLTEKTLLAAGQGTFDKQYREIAKTIMGKNVDFAPLDVESPIRVFVGAQREQLLSVKVLEYSIRKHSGMSVEVIPLYEAIERAGITIPLPSRPGDRPRTPFSFQRFVIPALKGYRGRAIYLDSDMQVFSDIRRLWLWPFGEANILSTREPSGSGRRPQFSVMVMNCSGLQWDVLELIKGMDEKRWTYKQLVYEMGIQATVSDTLPCEWNELERYQWGRTALTHYTDMDTQPWLSTDSLLGRIWCEDLLEAVDGGQIPLDFVRQEVERGFVRPSLLFQLENRIVDPLLLPSSILRNDREKFVPPHRLMQPAAMGRSLRRVAAIGRHLWKSSSCESFTRKILRRISG